MNRSKTIISLELKKAKDELAVSFERKGFTDSEVLQLGDRVDDLLNELIIVQKFD